MKGLLRPKYNRVVTVDAYEDVTGNAKGPFPVVLFSHGASGHRLSESGLLTRIAAWGFVVVSADYLEYGFMAQIPNAPRPRQPMTGRAEMLASLDLVTKAGSDNASRLHGLVDADHVASMGHSFGGEAAVRALNDPRVDVAIGWAPFVPPIAPVAKPTMIIGAGGDIDMTPAVLTKTYRSFVAPKLFLVIGSSTPGHNTFTDVCSVIRDGGGFAVYTRDYHLLPASLVGIALNGCNKGDLTPAQFWPIVQHLTVAELRSA